MGKRQKEGKKKQRKGSVFNPLGLHFSWTSLRGDKRKRERGENDES